jgi:hypothetical protein
MVLFLAAAAAALLGTENPRSRGDAAGGDAQQLDVCDEGRTNTPPNTIAAACAAMDPEAVPPPPPKKLLPVGCWPRWSAGGGRAKLLAVENAIEPLLLTPPKAKLPPGTCALWRFGCINCC